MNAGRGHVITFSLAAGSSIAQNAYGTNAYLFICSALVNMRVRGVKYGTGTYSTFSQATGIKTKVPFDTVEIQNENAFAVAIQLWVGDDDFIDNRSNLPSSNPDVPNIVFNGKTSPASVLIPDLSGNPFFDNNGLQWIAIQRLKIIICNQDTGGNVIQIQSQTSAAYNDGTGTLIVPALQDIEYTTGGDFSAWSAGGTIIGIISEIYQAILAG